MSVKARVTALTSLVWSGEEQREKNWQFEEKKGTWMGSGAKVGVRVQCTTCHTTLTFDGVYDSTTNELTFSRPDDADTWDGEIHFMHSRFLMDGPYIEWKHGQVWTAKNWKRWIRNSALGVAVFAVLMTTLRYVRKKRRETTHAAEPITDDTQLDAREEDVNQLDDNTKCKDDRKRTLIKLQESSGIPWVRTLMCQGPAIFF